MIKRMLKDLRKRMNVLSENLSKEIVIIKQHIETIKKEPISNEEYNI